MQLFLFRFKIPRQTIILFDKIDEESFIIGFHKTKNNIGFDLFYVNFHAFFCIETEKCFDCKKGILELKLNLLDRSSTNF